MAKPRRPAPADPSAATWRERLERVRATAVSAERTPEQVAVELRRRAVATAAPLVDVHGRAVLGREVLTFVVAGQTFGVDAGVGLEVVRVHELTPLPGTPAALRGLANIRSRIVPVFELDGLLGLPRAADAAPRTAVLTLSVDGAEFGLLVDDASGLRTLEENEARAPAPGLQSQFVQGLTADGLILLDLAAVAQALSQDERPS